MKKQLWKPVLGYEGIYEASSEGRIRRLAPAKGAHVGRILKPQIHGRYGYTHICLCREGTVKMTLTHRVIAEAFLGPCPEGLTVNHKNRKGGDNRACNLEYLTLKENNQHACANGRPVQHGAALSRNGWVDDDIREMRRRVTAGESRVKVAADYGTSHAQVSRICARLSWKHVE
jgi:hypothetical protein